MDLHQDGKSWSGRGWIWWWIDDDRSGFVCCSRLWCVANFSYLNPWSCHDINMFSISLISAAKLIVRDTNSYPAFLIKMSRLIKTFKVVPKELFRLNNGNITRLRDRSLGFGGSFDITSEAGMILPKGLNLATYKGDFSLCRIIASVHNWKLGPNGASMRVNSPD